MYKTYKIFHLYTFNCRYDDFFGTKGKASKKRKSMPLKGSEDDFDMVGPSSDGNRNEVHIIRLTE